MVIFITICINIIIISGEKFVRTMYHQGFTPDGIYREAIELKIPECLFPDCSVEKFAEMMSNLYPNTNRTTCHPVNREALL